MEKLYTKNGGFSVMLALLVLVVCGIFALQPNDPGAIAQQKMKPIPMDDGDWDYWSKAPDMFSLTAGNVGIGTTTPMSKLDVDGDVAVSGQITSSATSGTAPVCVDSTTACPNLNADMLDGLTSGDFPRKKTFHFASGGSSHIIDIPHYEPIQLMIGSCSGSADEIAFVTLIENDNYIAYLGFDGAGNQVRGSVSLYSVNTILTLMGGEWVLETYNHNPEQLRLISAKDDGKCVMISGKF